MRTLRYALITTVLAVFFAVLPAIAQDDTTATPVVTLDPAGADGNLIIQQKLETRATVDVLIGDQVYRLNVPVMVQIDSTTPLAAAQVSAPASAQVGNFLINPVGIQRVQGDYKKDYTTVSPTGSENELVIYTAEVTNLGNETYELAYASVLKSYAVDDTGKTFDEEARICDAVDPGETISCEFIFDAPTATNLVDLKFETLAQKQFSFAALGSGQ